MRDIREVVNVEAAMLARGFVLESMGGNLEAYLLRHDDGSYDLVQSEEYEGTIPTSPGEFCVVTHCGPDDSVLSELEGQTVQDVLAGFAVRRPR